MEIFNRASFYSFDEVFVFKQDVDDIDSAVCYEGSFAVKVVTRW